MKKKITKNIFVISNPVNFISTIEIIKKKKLKNIIVYIVNQKRPLNFILLKKLNLKINRLTLSKRLLDIPLSILSIIKLIYFSNSDNNLKKIYYGDFRWNFIWLVNLIIKPDKISIIDDGLDSIFFKNDKKNYGFKKNYFISRFNKNNITFEDDLYIPKFKKYKFLTKLIKSKIKKKYAKIFLGSAAPTVWLDRNEYYSWLKKKYQKENFYYFPHRREDFDEISLSVPKNKIIFFKDSFELFYLSLKIKPKKIISFPSTAIYFLRQFNLKQNILMLSFSLNFKKIFFLKDNNEWSKDKKIYSFLNKII